MVVRYVPITIPDFELDRVQITLCAWLVQSGEQVVSGDTICELSAGDISVEVPAPCSGVLKQMVLDLDAELQQGEVIAQIVC